MTKTGQRIALVVTTGVTLCVVALTAALARPLFLAPSNIALLFVSECPAAEHLSVLLRQAQPEAQAKIWAIPAEESVAQAQCPDTLPKLRSRLPLFRLVGDRMLCERLVAEARAFSERHAAASPFFVIDGELVPSDEERAAFARIGLSVGANRSGRYAELLTDSPRQGTRTRGQILSVFYQMVGY